MQQGIQVDLPKTKSPSLAEQEKPIVIEVAKDNTIHIGSSSITLGSLKEKLEAIYEKRERKEVFIHADQAISYGVVAAVMAQAQAAGIIKIGLVTQPKN
jgi:biopolymer transport protein TolR